MDSSSLTICFGKERKSVELPVNATLGDLRTAISIQFGIAPAQQKLLSGRTLPPSDSSTNDALELFTLVKPKGTVTLIASKRDTVAAINAASDKAREAWRNNELYSTHIGGRTKQTAGALYSGNGGVATLDNVSYGFRRIEVLPEFPSPNEAKRILEKLAADPGVEAVMAKYKWTVQVLKELSPAEVKILGHNKGRGLEIALRLREPSNVDEFRSYSSILSVLCHELAHMVHDEHDEDFRSLDRELNREVQRLNWKKGGQKVDSSVDIYRSSAAAASPSSGSGTASGVRLGGSNTSDQTHPNREMVAAAVRRRLTQLEQEQEQGCGTSSSGATRN
ncbi:WLM-domain-containing protein [Ramicandelaber brevisporus]|nr:WLM-domain-containing protein [Ramicandelaber brevisporus]